MQTFTCPFCGPRDETEFHFAAEAGKHRPEPAETTSDEAWADYLYMNAAPRGPARETFLSSGSWLAARVGARRCLL